MLGIISQVLLLSISKYVSISEQLKKDNGLMETLAFLEEDQSDSKRSL